MSTTSNVKESNFRSGALPRCEAAMAPAHSNGAVRLRESGYRPRDRVALENLPGHRRVLTATRVSRHAPLRDGTRVMLERVGEAVDLVLREAKRYCHFAPPGDGTLHIAKDSRGSVGR